MEREPEYSKDRLNQQIRSLMRENSMLKESLFRRDKEFIVLESKMLRKADRVTTFLSICLAVMTLAAIAATIWAVRMSP